MFRKRPLTWLFFLATVCVDLVIAAVSKDAFASLWQWGFCLGQAAVLGCWLAVGTRHRLERGALFVVGQIILATILSFRFLNGSLEVWGRMLASTALLGTMAAIGAFAGKFCFFRFRMKQEECPADVLRYSLMELVGWTVVVAIASAALRHVQLLAILKIPELLLFFMGFGLTIGLVAVLFIDRNNRYRYAPSLALGCTVAFYLIGYNVLRVVYPPYALAFIVSVAYVAIWIVVCRLDAPSPAHTAPQTPTDGQTSPPQPQPQAQRASAPQDPQLQTPPDTSRR